MKFKYLIRLAGMGLLIWAVPFAVSFGLYDRSGKLTVSYDFFKAVMVVSSSFIAGYILYRFFRNVEGSYLRHGLVAGLVWLLVNWIMDIVALLPIAGLSWFDYFTGIGFGYLQIPVVSTAVGYLLNYKSKTLKI
jgi:hypothetical protein